MQVKAYQFEPLDFTENEVEIQVLYFRLRHSDISILDADWQQTSFPFIFGHKMIGKVADGVS